MIGRVVLGSVELSLLSRRLEVVSLANCCTVYSTKNQFYDIIGQPQQQQQQLVDDHKSTTTILSTSSSSSSAARESVKQQQRDSLFNVLKKNRNNKDPGKQ
jgi:hypothetical protein